MPCTAPGALGAVHTPLASALRRGTSYLLWATTTGVSILIDAGRLVQRLACPDKPTTVAFDRRTGLIAVATASEVLLFEELYDIAIDDVHWRAAGTIALAETVSIDSLSWGTSGELLVSAASTLMLYAPAGRRSATTGGIEMLCMWRCAVGGKYIRATFSPDGNLIASFGADDRLVKVWRRLPDRTSSTLPGGRQSDFDFVYLKHSRAVTSVQWRTPAHEDLTVDNVLYTTSRDAVVRVWASDIPHDSHLLTLHGQVALTESDIQLTGSSLSSSPILSSSAPGTRARRGSLSRRGGIGTSIAAVMDDEVFAAAVKTALSSFDEHGDADDAPRRQAAHRLRQQRLSQPELLLCIGLSGGIEAHALTHIGSRSHKPATQHLIFADDKDILRSLKLSSRIVSVAIDMLKLGKDDAKLCMLIRTTEALHICELDLLNLFTQGRPQCLRPVATLSDAAGPHGGVMAVTKAGNNSIDVLGDRGAVCWQMTRDGRLVRTHAVQTVAEESSTGGHLVDAKHELAAEIVQDRIIVVTSTNESAIACTNRPLYIHRCRSKVVALAWHDARALEDPPCMAAVTEDGLLFVLQRTQTEDSDLSDWRVQWQATLDIAGTHVAFTQDSTVWAASGTELVAFGAAERGSPVAAATFGLYNPATLYTLLSIGRLDAAGAVLRELYSSLLDEREYNADLEKLLTKASTDDASGGGEGMVIDESMASSLKQLLATSPPAALSATEIEMLEDTIEAVVSAQAEALNLDAPGLHFYTFFVLATRRAARASGPIVLENAHVWFARCSETQESLLSLVRRPFESRLTWAIARQLRVFDWVREDASVIQLGEDVARSEFLHGGLPDEMDPSGSVLTPATFKPGVASGERDPVSAALWYWTLRRHAQVTSCWRLASSHRERTQTMRLLQTNDFSLPKARTTAAKNAYALLGRRRPRYAAAWFILANTPADALAVLHARARDPPLARAIAKLFAVSARTANPVAPALVASISAENRAFASDSLTSFVKQTVLPDFDSVNDRFGACLAAAALASEVSDLDVVRQLELLVLPLANPGKGSDLVDQVHESPVSRWAAARTLLSTSRLPQEGRHHRSASQTTAKDIIDRVLHTLPHLHAYATDSVPAPLRALIEDGRAELAAVRALAEIIAPQTAQTDEDGVDNDDDDDAQEETRQHKQEQPGGRSRLQQADQAAFQMEPDMNSFSGFDF